MRDKNPLRYPGSSALLIKIVGQFRFTHCHGTIEALKMLESLILFRFKLSFLLIPYHS